MARQDNSGIVDLAAHVGDALGDFRALYHEQHGMVWHALLRFGVTADLVDDAVQDTFVTAYRRRETFALGSSRGAWIYGIARRIAANYRRTAARQARKHRAAHAQVLPSTHPAHAQVALRTIERFVADLDADDREIFVLSELEGMSGPEVAEARGKNLHTTYSRIRKLRQSFRRELRDEGDVLLERSRRERPPATARGWAALLPALGVAKPAALVASTWAALAIGAAIGGAALTVVVSSTEAPSEIASVATSSVHEGPSPQRPEVDARAAGVDARVVEEPATIAVHDAGVASERPAQPLVKRRDPPVTTTASPTRAPAATPTPAPADGLRAETELLERASRQLAGADPAAALVTVAEHAARFPGSPLADLRVAVRVEALCASGERTRARTEAAAFLQRRPGSPVARRVRETCTRPSEKPTVPDNKGS